MLSIVILVLISFTHAVSAGNCCHGKENTLNDSTCVDGGPLVELDCNGKYILDPNLDQYDNFTIVGEFLKYKQHYISPKHYCVVKLLGDPLDVAVICAQDEIDSTSKVSLLITTICICVSIIFLMLTFVIYCLLPRLRDVQGKATMTAIFALIIGYIMLAILQLDDNLDEISCKVAAFIMYLFFMITFFWLNIISFNIWRSTVCVNWWGTEIQWYKMYCAYGFACPFILLIITIIASAHEGEHLKPGFGENSCWFRGKSEAWAYFYSPIAIIMCINTILFIMTSVHLFKEKTNATPQKLKILKYKFWLYLKLFFVMGLSWTFELLSSAFNDVDKILDYIWLVTDFINAIQGVLIFIILVALRKKVLRDLAHCKPFGIPYPQSWKNLQDEEMLEPAEDENHLENGNCRSQ